MFTSKHKLLLLYIVVTMLIVIVAWIISDRYYQLLLIQGSSMEPSYHNFQFVVLNKYDKNYKEGDVIAFNCEGLSAVLVKRIVATPGDTVQIIDGTLFVNGDQSDIYKSGAFDELGLLSDEILLDDMEYIVIGDNIPESRDSRYEEVGIVFEEDIIGIVKD